jgi:glycosyltransferase involved in cell wall biosynthesis
VIVEVVLPNDIDDPGSPSGGNGYDRRLCDGLAALGWVVGEHPVRGGWPAPTAAERAGLAALLDALPAGSVVLLDGLVASAVPEVLVPVAGRLRLVVLVHMPLGGAAEGAALRAASAVVATSGWTRSRLAQLYGVPASVATPGVTPAPLAPGSAGGTALLCVAALTPHKGHDVLIEALAGLDEPYTCVCAGSLERDPGHAARIRRDAPDRVRFAGALTGADLDAAYAGADLLVLPSRAETYGMVVTEALARGIPVLAAEVGGVPEALGRSPGGALPGLLVPPGDPAALAAALRRWLNEPELRRDLRAAARERRGTLTDWATTAGCVSAVLTQVAA